MPIEEVSKENDISDIPLNSPVELRESSQCPSPPGFDTMFDSNETIVEEFSKVIHLDETGLTRLSMKTRDFEIRTPINIRKANNRGGNIC